MRRWRRASTKRAAASWRSRGAATTIRPGEFAFVDAGSTHHALADRLTAAVVARTRTPLILDGPESFRPAWQRGQHDAPPPRAIDVAADLAAP